jgi:hypothetical protein
MPPATEVRRQAARLLPFRARDGRPRSRAIPTVLARGLLLVFARRTSDPDGHPLRKRDQLLVLLGAVAAF